MFSRAKATAGIFLHNAAEQWVDISYDDKIPSTYFMVESADFDLFFLSGPTPKETVRQFTKLTGTAKLPPVSPNQSNNVFLSYICITILRTIITRK